MRHISQVIAIAICVIGLTSIATAQDNTALPTDWTTETPIAWLNAQATPDLAPQAPAVNEPPAEGGDAYAIALEALVSVILGVVNTTGGAVYVGAKPGKDKLRGLATPAQVEQDIRKAVEER